jgi:hypothetical protein
LLKVTELPNDKTDVIGNRMCKVSSIVAAKLKYCSCAPYGKDNQRFVPGRSWTLPYEPLAFADFNLYLFALISHSC